MLFINYIGGRDYSLYKDIYNSIHMYNYNPCCNSSTESRVLAPQKPSILESHPAPLLCYKIKNLGWQARKSHPFWTCLDCILVGPWFCNVTSTIVKGGPPLNFIFFFRGGLLCNGKSKIPTLPKGFCKVLTNPLFSDGLWWDLLWILIGRREKNAC